MSRDLPLLRTCPRPPTYRGSWGGSCRVGEMAGARLGRRPPGHVDVGRGWSRVYARVLAAKRTQDGGLIPTEAMEEAKTADRGRTQRSEDGGKYKTPSPCERLCHNHVSRCEDVARTRHAPSERMARDALSRTPGLKCALPPSSMPVGLA